MILQPYPCDLCSQFIVSKLYCSYPFKKQSQDFQLRDCSLTSYWLSRLTYLLKRLYNFVKRSYFVEVQRVQKHQHPNSPVLLVSVSQLFLFISDLTFPALIVAFDHVVVLTSHTHFCYNLTNICFCGCIRLMVYILYNWLAVLLP